MTRRKYISLAEAIKRREARKVKTAKRAPTPDAEFEIEIQRMVMAERLGLVNDRQSAINIIGRYADRMT